MGNIDGKLFLLDLTQQNFQLMKVICKNDSEHMLFMSKFWTNNQFFDIMDFRTYKQKQNPLTEDDFCKRFCEGDKTERKNVLETLFQQYVSDFELDKLEEEYEKDSLFIRQIFREHTKNPDLFLLRLLST